jgi:hypothetical protein
MYVLRKATINVRTADPDSKEEPPEYKSRALLLQYPALDYTSTAMRGHFVSHVGHGKYKQQFEEMWKERIAAYLMVMS